MSALVVVRCIDAGTDQSHRYITTGPPKRFSIGTIVSIDICFVRNPMNLGQLAQLLCQAFVIDTAGILDAQRGIELIRTPGRVLRLPYPR